MRCRLSGSSMGKLQMEGRWLLRASGVSQSISLPVWIWDLRRMGVLMPCSPPPRHRTWLKFLMNFIGLIEILENCVRMTSLHKIREPRSCSPHRVLILRTMFSNPQGVVEMAEDVAVVAQNVEDRVVASPPEWILISLIFRCRVRSSLRLTHVRTMLIVPSVISSLTPLPHYSSTDMFEAHIVYSPA